MPENIHADTAPALSIPVMDPIGRLYRRPDGEPLPTGPNGGVILPSWDEIVENIRSGKWLPSITNIVGVRNSPHLIGWAARKSAKTAIEMETQFKGSLTARPTGALRYLSTAHDRDRDAAADLGTRVHYACELLANDKEVPPGLLAQDELPYLDAWKRWRDDFAPRFIQTEMTVFGETAEGKGYAGTTDFLCEINDVIVVGDIKTTRSGLHDDVAYQLSAVTHATHYSPDGITLKSMMQIDSAYALHLSKKGYKFAPVVVDGEPWETFKAERQIWDIHVLEGLLPDGRHVIGSPVNSPEQVIATR